MLVAVVIVVWRLDTALAGLEASPATRMDLSITTMAHSQVSRTQHPRTAHPSRTSNILAILSTAMRVTTVSKAVLSFNNLRALISHNVEVTPSMPRPKAHRQEKEGMEMMVSSDN